MRLRAMLFLSSFVPGAATFLFGFMNMLADPHSYDAVLLVIGGILFAVPLVVPLLPLARQLPIRLLSLLLGMSVSLGLWAAYSMFPAKQVDNNRKSYCHVCRQGIENANLKTVYYNASGGTYLGASPPPDARRITVHDYCTPPASIQISEAEPLYSSVPTYRWERSASANLCWYGAILLTAATIGLYVVLLKKRFPVTLPKKQLEERATP